jgi:hypothetical protein
MIFINRRNSRNTNNNNIQTNNNSIMPIVHIRPPVVSNDVKPIIKKERVKEMLWGEPTWFLFHTLAEKTKDNYFPTIKNELFSFIKKICNNLPCPECAQHASRYVNGVNFDAINTKKQLVVFLFNFHNEVNRRKDYEAFEFTDIDKYKNAITINIVKNFFYHFGKKSYSVRLDINGHQRSLLLKDLKEWLEKHTHCFEE